MMVCSKCGALRGAVLHYSVVNDTTVSVCLVARSNEPTRVTRNSSKLSRFVEIDQRTGLCKVSDIAFGCHYQFLEWIVSSANADALSVSKDRWEECRGRLMVTNI